MVLMKRNFDKNANLSTNNFFIQAVLLLDVIANCDLKYINKNTMQIVIFKDKINASAI